MEAHRSVLSVTQTWKSAYPGASAGVLAMGRVANPESSPELDAHKIALEADLRSAFGALDRNQLKSHPLIAPYTAYYKRFDKTYHVQHQLESIVFKGKTLPRAAALIEAMFMAELRNMLLTAGHDLDSVRGYPILDVATGTETYSMLSGRQQTLKHGDMFIHDEEGILSSVIYGPDHRTRITPVTTQVLFTVYAPAGVPPHRVRAHLGDLEDLVLAVSPEAQVQYNAIVEAGPEG